MKRKIPYILIFIVIILTYEVIQSYSLIHVEISEQEQEEINSFYEINPESITHGEQFDLKYVYVNTADQYSKPHIEIVLKNNTMPYKIVIVRYYDKNGKPFLWHECSQNKVESIQDMDNMITTFKSSNQYRRFGWLIDAWLMIHGALLFNSESVVYDYSEIIIEMEIKKGLWDLQKETERYHISFDEDTQLSSSRKIKDKLMNGQPCNDYEKRQVNYYFGILFRRSFDQWYDEVKEFLSENQNAVFYPGIVLNLSSYEYEEVRKINHLDKEQWIKYKEIVRLMIDLNILAENIDWV